MTDLTTRIEELEQAVVALAKAEFGDTPDTTSMETSSPEVTALRSTNSLS